MDYKIAFVSFILLVFNLHFAIAQTIHNPNYTIENNVSFLSNDALQGRLVGSAAEKESAEFIKHVFQSYSLDTLCTNGFFHDFEFEYHSNPHDTSAANRINIKSRNVVGYLNNHASSTILIGAHYDHIGRNEHHQSMLPNLKNEIHNGADDNASGVAGVLEIARLLSTDSITENANYIFACFSAEEVGLVGSKKLVEFLQSDLSISIDAMINMDMIGRMDSVNTLNIGGLGTSSVFPKMIDDNKPEHFNLVIDSSGIGPSDHSSFYLKNIPVLFFHTGSHSDYHKPTDDFEKINFPALKEISDFIYRISIALSAEEEIDFLKTKNPSEKRSTSYKVTLGIMPNYSHQTIDGLMIDDVIEGKLAHKIGMKSGDIIIKINTCEVNDIYSYMACLSNFDYGNEAIIWFLRGDKIMNGNVLF